MNVFLCGFTTVCALSLATVFSTAHSAKGLEFHTVKIDNDFLEGSHSGTDDFTPSKNLQSSTA